VGVKHVPQGPEVGKNITHRVYSPFVEV
jgi:hypothetical protein